LGKREELVKRRIEIEAAVLNSAAAAVGEIDRTQEGDSHQNQDGNQKQENDHSSIS
jgi:hypothetical protein